jgi:sigma-54 dependent transcriptional regulator, acetoin dehydrogenase operon transcriptional activator AcoR
MNLKNYEFLVLFLNDGPNSLQLIAEYLARSLNIPSIKFIGASLSKKSIFPDVRKILMDFHIEIPPSYMLTIEDVDPHDFDLIITLGEAGYNNGLQLPPMVPHFHWEIPETDLSREKTITRNVLKKSKNIIQENLNQLFESDFLKSIFVVSKNLRLILDNLQEGVMAHTQNRKIVFFNKAAEKITGYKKEYVIGRDCHKVFPGRFCGGDCNFCQKDEIHNKRLFDKKVDFKGLDGKSHVLKMTLLPLSDDKKDNIGALISFKDETELETLKSRLKHHHSLDELIGKDPKMLNVFSLIKEVAPVSASVLVEGESGTGKELVARAIHNLSARAKKPFIAINCGAIPEGLLESELFGHVKGAFTGAIRDKKGRFELANHGTLFLDEIGELSPTMQVKLLRVLQERSFEQVGGENLIKVDIRIISATNQDLRKLVKTKKFRRDLFYRLCVIPIHLPSLQERRMDIITLVEHFIEIIAGENQVTPLEYSNDIIDILSSYSWPGNVRELRNAIEFAYVKCHDGKIQTEHLPGNIMVHTETNSRKPGPPLKYDKEKIIQALSETEGNRQKTAKLLNIGRATLYRYLNIYGLN